MENKEIELILKKEKSMRMKVYNWRPTEFVEKVEEINKITSYIEKLERIIISLSSK